MLCYYSQGYFVEQVCKISMACKGTYYPVLYLPHFNYDVHNLSHRTFYIICNITRNKKIPYVSCQCCFHCICVGVYSFNSRQVLKYFSYPNQIGQQRWHCLHKTKLNLKCFCNVMILMMVGGLNWVVLCRMLKCQYNFL